MAKKKKSRKELLKGPDEFVTFSSRAADFISTHLNQLKYLGYAVVAIAVGYFAIQIWMGQVNEKGQTAYNTAADDMRNWMMKPDPDIADLQKSGELFSEVLEKHSMSNAARLALPLAAHVKFLEKDYSEAIKQYRNFLDEFSGDALYESLARLALASCYEAEGELKTAIETLNPLVEDASGKRMPILDSRTKLVVIIKNTSNSKTTSINEVRFISGSSRLRLRRFIVLPQRIQIALAMQCFD